LPAASFRFHLTMDTLAVQLTIPPVGFVGDFHSLVSAPCRAHKQKPARANGRAGLFVGFDFPVSRIALRFRDHF
jgi:hypothetical protein